MARAIVAANAYRWACPTIEQIISQQPTTAVDLLRADAATKHYVALAVRGWELRHARSEPVLRRLASEIFAKPRPAVLAGIWGQRFGKVGFLKRLPSRVLTRRQYDRLVSTLGDPVQRRLLNQCQMISPTEIEVIAHFDDPVAAAASLRNVSKIGTELFDYALAAVRRHRPDLDDAALIAVLREFGRATTVTTWLRNVLRHASLPPPPWSGTKIITPLRTVAEIRAAGFALRNCLRADEAWLSALLGERCYYRVDGLASPAIVAITRDALLGAWRIESWRGPANASLKRADQRSIREAFATAGIGFFGDWPRSRALEGCDPDLGPW